MRFVLLLPIIISFAFAQQPIRVANAASFGFGSMPGATFAPGSLIRVELNPVSISGGLVPVDPDSVSIQIQPAGSAAIVGPADFLGVIARLSDDIPLGPASLSMTFNGQTSAAAAISIVPSSFGLFTQGSGTGPILAVNSLTKPARPGDFVTLWGTGLGSPPTNRVAVLLGGHPFPALYAGPAPGLPGTDQINFQVPDDPTIPYGCYVAIAVQVQNYASNIATISTTRDGSVCQDPFGFTTGQLAQLDAGQNVFLGQVNLYDMVGPPAPQQWFYSSGFTRTESADASFFSLNSANVAVFAEPLQAADAYYGCYRSDAVGARLIGVSGSLNAGDKLELASATESLDLTSENPEVPGSLYRVQLPLPSPVSSPDAVPPPFFSAGVWQVSGTGSTDVQPFRGTLAVPPPLHIANPSDLATIDHTQDLIVRWNGNDYSDDYTALAQLAASSTIVCRAPASAGQLTVPAALMQNLSQAANNNGLELLLTPRPDRIATFQVPLTNGGTVPALFRYYPSEIIPIQVQ